MGFRSTSAGSLRPRPEIQATITGVLGEETAAAGVEVLGGVAAGFDGSRAVIDGRPVESEAVIIATGSRPALPPVPGIAREGVYTAATLASMKTVPGRVAIVGGGVQAAELAYIFAAFGAEVELVVRSDLLPGLDPHLARLARKELEGVHLHERTALVSVDGGRRVAGVTLSAGGTEEQVEVDAVIAAIGLAPNSEECAGLEKRKNGTIVVDDRMRTSVPGVYACGDVIGPPYLTPVARQEGRVAAENVLGGETRMDWRLIPRGFRLGNQYAWAIDDSAASSYAIPGPAGPGSFFAVPERETGVAKVFLDETGDAGGRGRGRRPGRGPLRDVPGRADPPRPPRRRAERLLRDSPGGRRAPRPDPVPGRALRLSEAGYFNIHPVHASA